jgi:hypothetical protein
MMIVTVIALQLSEMRPDGSNLLGALKGQLSQSLQSKR